jgi:gluconokinase
LKTNITTLFLFGLAGSGKSYLANFIAKEYGYFHYEGDDDLTPSMKQAIKAGAQFTDAMRMEFFQIIGDRILELRKEHDKIVVSQAMYKNIHRNYLLSRFPDLQLVWVKASDEVIMERIQKRGIKGVDEAYVKAIRANFEEPEMNVKEIINDEKESLRNLFLWINKIANTNT